MDGETFDDLVKRLAAVRLTRVDALRGLLAGAAVGLTGATLADDTAAKKKTKAGKKGHGKDQAKARKAKDHKGKAQNKHQAQGKGNHAHPKAKPVVCPNGRCDVQPKKCRTEKTGCVCVGTGPQSRCALATTTTAAGTTTTAAGTTTTPGICTPASDACDVLLPTCGGNGACVCDPKVGGGSSCDNIPFACATCNAQTGCPLGAVCVVAAGGCCAQGTACATPCSATASAARASGGGRRVIRHRVS